MELYKVQADDLHAGRVPRLKTDGLMVGDLCNRFLTAKLRKREAGELGNQAFADYKEVTDLLVASFESTRLVDDLAAADFGSLRASMAKRWGPVRLGNAITRVKSVFKFALDNALTEKTIRYGTEFKKPDKSVLRRHRAKGGERMVEAEQLRQLVEAATLPLKAMILLGVNCGFGNGDCATLPLASINLETGWIDYPRPKTGIGRRCPLWPETVAAIRDAIAARPQSTHDEDTGLLFLNQRGARWVQHREKNRSDLITLRFKELLKAKQMHRKGVSFYTLRHVFQTIADSARDPVAISIVMGHADHSMADHYRERVDENRLRAVTDHVHNWLFGRSGG